MVNCCFGGIIMTHRYYIYIYIFSIRTLNEVFKATYRKKPQFGIRSFQIGSESVWMRGSPLGSF